MPVPVPHRSKQPAHLVVKPHCSDDGIYPSFPDLTGLLPVSPTGPPPSRAVEQDFQTGLAAADNASAIDRSRAKACPPPFDVQPSSFAPTVKEAATSIERVPHGPLDTAGKLANDKAVSIATNQEIEVYDHQDRSASTPIFEDDSPEFRSVLEVSSSPLEPVTPFGGFVDRAVSSTSAALSGSYVSQASLAGAAKGYLSVARRSLASCCAALYRIEWIVNFVWKECATGTNIPSSLAKVRLVTPKAYAVAPTSHLATSILSLWLSTLLQPSAIFLALWYIVRLPVSFVTVSMTADRMKELCFRMVSLGENHGLTQDVTHNTAPFRLIVLGCMLANKWLDDLPLSNKTWYAYFCGFFGFSFMFPIKASPLEHPNQNLERIGNSSA
ncbi:hypothetical protein F5051DRAFT_446603 [Lentinula edodes]|nr:hypothetical protein F5051DRAFT_446603 [Lentinula edodes]